MQAINRGFILARRAVAGLAVAGAAAVPALAQTAQDAQDLSTPPQRSLSCGTVRTVAPSPPATRGKWARDLTPEDLAFQWAGRTRTTQADVSNAADVSKLEAGAPLTARALFQTWADAADVFWIILHNMEARGVTPQNTTPEVFQAEVQAAFSVMTHDRVGPRARAAADLAVYASGSPGIRLHGPFAQEVVPCLYAEMKAIDARLALQMAEKHGIELSTSDAAALAVVGHMTFTNEDPYGARGVRPSNGLHFADAAARDRLIADMEKLRGYFGQLGAGGRGVFAAGFDMSFRERRAEEVAKAFGAALRAHGLEPRPVGLAIVAPYPQPSGRTAVSSAGEASP